MANYGTTQQRPSTISPPAPAEATQVEDSTRKRHPFTDQIKLRLVCPLKIPSSPEAAALRIVKNLSHLAIYYVHFVWIVLLITLIPCRKVSLIYLVIMTYVASLYSLLLRAFPASYLLHKVIDKRVVLAFIAVVTMVELIATSAGLHLILTLAATTPVVLVHATFWAREDPVQLEDESVVLLGSQPKDMNVLVGDECIEQV